MEKKKPNNIIPKWSSGFCGEERDLEQTQLVFGIEGLKNSDIDRYSLRALTIILGGGMSSRLFQEIREKKGLCYSIFAFSQIQKTFGTLGFYAGTSPDNVDDLIDTSLKELKKIREQKKLDFDIEIDGGINFDNCKSAINAGANILVSGTTVFKSNDGDIKKNINLLKLK